MNAQAQRKLRDRTIEDTRSDIVRWFESDELSITDILSHIREQGQFAPLYTAILVDYVREHRAPLQAYYEIPTILDSLSRDGWDEEF